MSLVSAIARLAFETGTELWREWRADRARQRAQRAWAETPVTPRACPRCREIAYGPGQMRCDKCGGLL